MSKDSIRKLVIASVISLASTLASALVVNDKVSPSTGGVGLNVRSCPSLNNNTCPVVVALTDTKNAGTVVGGPITADKRTWYQVAWDNGYSGWSDGQFLQMLADNAPDVSQVGLATQVSGKTQFSGFVTDDWNLKEVGMYVDGKRAFFESVFGKSWSFGGFYFDPTSPIYSKGQGTYSVQIYAKDIKSTSNKTFTVTYGSPDKAPVISINQSSYTINQGQSINYSGTATDDKAVTRIRVEISKNGGSFITVTNQSVNSSSVDLRSYAFSATSSTYFSGPGTYDVRIYAFDAAGQYDSRQVLITVDGSVDFAPTITLNLASYSINHGQAISFAGTVSDDKALSRIAVDVSKNGGAFVNIRNDNVTSSSLNLSSYGFSATSSNYYSGAGTYIARIYAYDQLGQNDVKQVQVIVKADNTARINEIQNLLAANNQSITTANSTISQLNAQSSNLASQIGSYNTSLNSLQSQLISLVAGSPNAPSNPSNTSGMPAGCVIVNGQMPFDFQPMAGHSYQAVAHCHSGASGKGDVYLLLGYTYPYEGLACKAAPMYSFSYPAAVLFVPKALASVPYLIQKVSNKDQALFWIAYYKTSMVSSFASANASIRSDPANAAFDHPDESTLAKITAEYIDFRTNLRDYIEDSVYELDQTLTEAEMAMIMEVLSASIGSIPYLQEVKGGVELCSGEDILTAEPVSVWGAWAYVIPFGKIAQKFDKFKHIGRITKVIGSDPTQLLSFSKNLLSSKARKGSNEIGNLGDTFVRSKHSVADIGSPVTKAIEMSGNQRKPDGLNALFLSEIKNRKSVSCTSQLRDYAKYAFDTQKTFKLFVRTGLAQQIMKNKSFNPGGKCWPVKIFEENMPF